MFRSKKTKTEVVPIGDIKDWRDAGHEIENLGVQLDNARNSLAEAKSPWAKNFWGTTVERLYTKWQLTIQLKDTGLKQKGPNSFYSKIDYDWWETSEEIKLVGFTWMDHWFDNAGLQDRLEESWAKSKELKLEKARLGLA